MAYTNFKPVIYTAEFETELEKALVFAEDCNRKYEGEVKEKGDRVKILGVGDPTVTTKNIKDFSGLSDPEEVEDSSVWLDIDQMSYYNVGIGDIDKQLAQNGLMDIMRKKAVYRTANEIDTFIAKLYAGAKSANTIDISSLTTDNVLEYIDNAIEILFGNDVPANEQLVLTIPPKFFTKLKQAYIAKDTDNSQMLANGRVGRYGNIQLKMSNNVAKDTNNYDKIMLRTRDAIAYANPLNVVEPYRVEKNFKDALKGFALYGGKVVRPEQIAVLSVQAYGSIESV